MQIVNAKPGRIDGGYTRVFDNEQLGALISRVHSASISSGLELEKLILEKSDLFLVQTTEEMEKLLTNGEKFDKKVNNWENNPERVSHFVLPYKLFINFAPGNVYYRWEFKHINAKYEVSTEGVFQDNGNIFQYLTNVSVSVLGSVGWNPEVANILPQNHIGEVSTEQEAQTDRMFKSTYRNFLDKCIEPAMFSSNTIDFHYSLGEFFNRLTDPIFFYRVEVSEMLYNRLSWANNKQKTHNLPVQWNNYAKFGLKLGYWRWREVDLESDVDNFFTNLMNKGFWLTEGERLDQPNFKLDRIYDYVQLGGNAWDITVAESEVIEIVENHEGQENTGGDTVRPASTSVYIEKISRVENEETEEKDFLEQAINALPSDALKKSSSDKYWYFWHNKDYTATIDIPMGSYTQQIIGFNSSGSLDTGQKGDKLTIKLNGTNLSVKVHGKFIRKEVKITERQTQTRENNLEELETREEETEPPIEEEIDIDNLEMEEPEGEIGNLAGEIEEESETEWEDEEELEPEEEIEDEIEDEQEQEDEQEKEGESEEEYWEPEGEGEGEIEL